MITIHHGDCLDVLRTLADNSVDSVVTDPPYGLSFMGKRWDYDVPSVDIWRECLRVLKPGGHLLAFAGTRTQHRMAVRIEDAGFEIRDMIAWVYGSGFPKSLDVSKAIDNAAGAVREVVGSKLGQPGYHLSPHNGGEALGHGLSSSTYETRLKSSQITAPATDAARQWQGWGTALKPALEPITVARKPLDGTVAETVLRWGTGGINVDGCRVAPAEVDDFGRSPLKADGTRSASRTDGYGMDTAPPVAATGRFPANLIHDGSDEVVGLFPVNAGASAPASGPTLRCGSQSVARGRFNGMSGDPAFHADSGSAARFFYCAKASKADRDDGCGHLAPKTAGEMTGGREEGSAGLDSPRAGAGRNNGARNHHPTVKPTELMRYLCRLVTPPGGTVLDPFVGSGSTGRGAALEGFAFIGVEREAEYVEIAKARIAAVAPEPESEAQPQATGQLTLF